jgi:hypothetical protein
VWTFCTVIVFRMYGFFFFFLNLRGLRYWTKALISTYKGVSSHTAFLARVKPMFQVQ